MYRAVRFFGVAAIVAVCACVNLCLAEPPLVVGVMDPLALPLSCPCVEGHAQRRYEKLAAFLEGELRRPVEVVFSEDLSKILRGDSGKPVHVVIGKQSVVRFDANTLDFPLRPAMMLTGKDGKTTLVGLVVVRTDDPARTLGDLTGYTVLFGPPASDEKFAAAVEALRKAGIKTPAKPETRPGCSDSVLEMLDNPDKPIAAVISSYAAALLEGCGTIEKGSIRVVGETAPAPFVTVFFTDAVDEALGAEIRAALAAVVEHPDLLTALETQLGFVPIDATAKPSEKKPETASPPPAEEPAVAPQTSWPGWRGPGRDGVVAHLPARLPKEARILWSKELTGKGLAGIVATEDFVIIADRDAMDCGDVFRCLDAASGIEIWTLEYATSGEIQDYGSVPRATPLVAEGMVYALGGLGDLHCARLATGEVVWSRNLVRDFGGAVPTWGYCSSPLLVDGKLIVNPGAKDASLVALDCASGAEVWRCPGLPAAYASFIVGRFGGERQIVGYDEKTLGGWDPETGRRLWTLVPPAAGDFNVPTPIDAGGRLIVASETNGTRLFDFEPGGAIVPEPVARNEDLAPDASTPVLVGGRLFGCWDAVYCLKADSTLAAIWTGDEDLGDYSSVVASPDRVLVVTKRGELLLIDAAADAFTVVSRLRIFADDAEVLSHPALVGSRLYLRDMAKVVCVDLSED
ncbi:MAG: PQQ-binding-like beta-propeller repeat protein [Pirellulales bacterium]|nr:PQQ-binding-like beta-propeller repeat protein [Pirellulales bacterium]